MAPTDDEGRTPESVSVPCQSFFSKRMADPQAALKMGFVERLRRDNPAARAVGSLCRWAAVPGTRRSRMPTGWWNAMSNTCSPMVEIVFAEGAMLSLPGASALNTVDKGSTHDNYGSSVLGLMACFQ
jgi:hypothetical protein